MGLESEIGFGIKSGIEFGIESEIGSELKQEFNSVFRNHSKKEKSELPERQGKLWTCQNIWVFSGQNLRNTLKS